MLGGNAVAAGTVRFVTGEKSYCDLSARGASGGGGTVDEEVWYGWVEGKGIGGEGNDPGCLSLSCQAQD